MAFSARMQDMMKKYGKVAIGVHLSVSAASITGLYVAIKNNFDVQSLFEKVGLSSTVSHDELHSSDGGDFTGDPSSVILKDCELSPLSTDQGDSQPSQRNKTAEMAASSGGALALAILCNKALFPVRVPITIGLTPPIAKFLARRNLIKVV